MELKILLTLMFIKAYFHLLNLMLNPFLQHFVRVESDLEEEVLDAAAISGTVPAKPEDGREGQHLPPLPRLELWHFFFFLLSAPQDMPIKQFKKSKVMKMTSKFKTQAIAPTVTFCVYISIYILTEISEKNHSSPNYQTNVKTCFFLCFHAI